MRLHGTQRSVRPAAVAGMFYEGRAEQLRAEVDRMLLAAGPREPQPITGVIVPHAGHIYSGPVAASAYRLLPRSVQRVLLIGPSHFVPLRAMAGSGATAWRTPLGEVDVDRDETDRLAAQFPDAVVVEDAAHGREHCLEVQVPFLQRVLQPGWRLLPFVVGHLPAQQVAAVIADSLRVPGTLLVVSTDLSHYLPYERAAVKDRSTAQRIVARESDLIEDDDACGAYALRGALHYAAEQNAELRLLDLRSSGDTAGPRDRVVGYAAVLIGPTKDRGGRMLALARRTIEEALATGRQAIPTAPALDEDLRAEGAAFVTLRTASTGELLGCIGSLEAYRPLGVDIAAHALDAAFHDPRFAPLTAARANDMRIDISVLGPLEEFPCTSYQDLVARAPVGMGLFIAAGGYRATFLPQVWQELPGPAQFVDALWRKAGLVPGTWPHGITVATYGVEEYTE